jgi:hypothetical protein
MGFAQYCMNCHASAANNLTFASPKNIQGEAGQPLNFLSQDFFTRRHRARATSWLCCPAMRSHAWANRCLPLTTT